ncbi:MAG: response regulator [Cyclobacteriaceae bacterium]
MMNFLQGLSIRTKLILLSLIPLAGLLYYLQINVRQELKTKNNAEEVIQDVKEIQEISKLLHEFQKERALTLIFLSGSNNEIKDDILRQWEATDKAVFDLEKILKQLGRAIPDFRMIDSLAFIRAKVNVLSARAQIDPFYQEIKLILLEGVAQVLRSSQNLQLKNHFDEHLFLLYSKEYLAQIRSELGTALSTGRFSGRAYGEFASGKGKHEINLSRLKRIASPELKSFFDRKYQGLVVHQTYLVIDSAFNSPSLAHFPYNYDAWWDASSSSINALKEVEDYSSELIGGIANEELTRARASVARNAGIALLIIMVISLAVVVTLRGIIRAISSIKNAADLMAQGDGSAVLDIKSRDEIGALASSFNKMIQVTKKFSSVANAIGKGDYSAEVQVRGTTDTLGIALSNMKSNLQQLSRDNEIRTWLLTGNNKVSDSMRGEKDVNSLAQDVIIQITNHLGGQIGAIYLVENHQLQLVGSYAYHHRKENTNYFKFGQGLVGQAALEKKSIVFNDVPDDYIRIHSGLGNSVPRSIIVFPFLFEGEVKGVVEIGATQEFTDLHMQFFTMVGENIAIAFHASQSRTVLKELLEETQRQAEELEAQQEELKQSNEELHEKTGLLEKSEGELKAQQEELQQSNEELEEKANLLEQQKEKLELAKMEIENKARDLEVTSKYKSEFLANMSHELRTPLNSILILSQLLVENKNRILGDKEVEFCKNIYNSGADLLTLINEILDLSKVESGRMELDVSEVPFSDIRSGVEAMFTELAKDQSIDFEVEVQGDLGQKTVRTDKQRMDQILRNLLSNAFKFTANNGSVSMKIRRAAPDTPFRNSRLNDISDVIAFSVTDNGIGVPANKQSVIFEAFQQGDGSTKRKYGGTGLGLSISRELANVLGGEIQLESEERKGSTFTLYLPLQFDASAIVQDMRKVEVKERKKNPPGRSNSSASVERFHVEEEIEDDRHQIFENDKVVLILEDDPEFSRVLLDFVRGRNYKGIVAASGNTGLSYARHYKPDAIILDMKLPVMDGTEVLRHLKNDPDLRHIPVQIISGYDHRKQSLELGAFDFVSKPISTEGLTKAFDRIEEFMRKKLKKLLVIEDDRTQNQAIRELVGNDDIKSFSAFSGAEAYAMMTKVNYDCVILDLGLPDMPSFELLEKIKQNQELKKIPIIVYTGRDISQEEHGRLVKFASAVVLKTVDSHERLLDETMLFLHRVEALLPKEKQNIIRKLHKTDEVLENRKVLVVDDDIRNIYSLTNLLEEQGLHCISAENGKIALQLLKKHHDIEMVLMDVMMPEMDGYEATKAIRAMPQFSKLPVIALTAKAMKGDREKCLSSGMSDYIAKPLNNEQLLSLMRIWLYR